MIGDRYNIEIDDAKNQRFKTIANNIISGISNDIVLMKTGININEINNRTLVKIKEYLDANPSIFSEDVDDLPMKLQELEEKRKIASIILQESNPDVGTAGTATNSIASTTTNSTTSPLPDIKMLTDAVFKIVEKQKQPVYKNLVINSHNRDWITSSNRNSIKFNINIDVSTHCILPHSVYFVPHIKQLTPYVSMHISDGVRTQKYNFVYSKSVGAWDEWKLLLPSVENISLKNKTWNISFYDYINKELPLGKDNITVSEVALSPNDKKFVIKISENMELLEPIDYVLLKTCDGDIEYIKIERRSDKEYLVYNDNELEQKDFINSHILNLKEQYTVVLSYYVITL